VRVAIEPADPSQMAKLAAGLRLLNRADPFVEVTVQESGEHVVGAAGERTLARRNLDRTFTFCSSGLLLGLLA